VSREDLILYLKQYVTLDKSIDRKFEAVEKLQDAASRTTRRYEPKVKGGSIYKAGNALAKKIDLEKSLLDDLSRLIDLHYELDALFGQVNDHQLRLLLLYRYIDGYTFERIAGKLELSLRYVFRLHKQALEEVWPIWTAQKGC
jgi:hypothetical protein